MLEEMKKGLLAALGGVVLSREKLDEWRRKMVKEKRMSEEEAKGWMEELAESGEKQWKDFEKSFKKTLQKNLQGLNMADRKEVEKLRLRVKHLEERVAALEARESNPARGTEQGA